MLVDVGVFEPKVTSEASVARAKHLKRTLLRRPIDFRNTEMIC